jgi:hypothetical protein
MMDHHIFPKQFEQLFRRRGIDIDNYTVALGEASHLRSVHGAGSGNMPGRWNQIWDEWFRANPNATAREIYQQGGLMMDLFGINHLPITPY